MVQTNLEGARERFVRAKELARESLEEARRSVWNLRAKPLEELSLTEAIRREVDQLAEAIPSRRSRHGDEFDNMETIMDERGARVTTQVKDAIIRTKNLQKIYDTGEVKVHALRGIDLEVFKGEMVAVMGPSGCGKTTLLNCLSGIDEPSEGTVVIAERELYEMRDRTRTDFRAKNMGFIFQFFNLLPVLSVAENVELPLLIGGVKPSEARKRSLLAIELVGLAGQGNKRPKELSGGQQQRVAIARALVNEPEIVWCDEPTGNLDSETADEVMNVLCKLNKGNGQTFVLVTHSAEVGTRADRIIRMRDGLIEKDYENGGASRAEVVRNTDR